MFLVFASIMLGTVMGQTSYPNSIGNHSSPSLYNIIDGHIPPALSVNKGCKRDLQLSDVKPSTYVPISCANVRYSVFDDHVFTLTRDKISVQRKYSDKLSISDGGVCKIQVSSMRNSSDLGLFSGGVNIEFLNRYGYCDDGELEDAVLTEVVSDVTTSCGDEGKEHILTKTECSVYSELEVEEIYDKTKPYGCVDGKFNSFDRSKDLHDDEVEAEANVHISNRIQDLKTEFADIESYLGSAYISDVPEHQHYEPTIEIESGSAYNILKMRLQNIRDQIKSVHLKQAYYNSLVDYVTQQQATITKVRKNYDRAIEISNILNKYVIQSLGGEKLDLQYTMQTYTELKSKYNEIYTNATTIKNELSLADELVELQQLMDVYNIYKNYMDEHYHRDRSTASKLQSWCNSLEEHGELMKGIGCIPNLDFDLHCVPDGAIYEYTEPLAKYDASGNVYYTDIGTCSNKLPGGSITNCPVACDPDRTPNTVGKNYSHLEWNNPKSNQTADLFKNESEVVDKVGLTANTLIVNNLSCPYNYICTQGYTFKPHIEEIATQTVENTYSYRYEYGIEYDLQTSFMDYESVYRSIDCAPFCFPDLSPIPDEDSSDINFSPTERQPTKRKANADIIFSDILRLEMSTSMDSLLDLYKELVKQNLHCESGALCTETCYKLRFNSVDDAIRACSARCSSTLGFFQYWDESPVRQTNRVIRNRRHECRCGSPKLELECVMANNEWKPDIFVTQYIRTPVNPVIISNQLSDRYLFCPASHCTDGFVDQRCNKHSYLGCNVGTECSDVSARMIVNGSPQSFKDNAYHMSEGQFFFGYNVYSGERIGGVVTNLDGDILSTGIVGSYSPTLDMWNDREELGDWTFSITDFIVDFEDPTDTCEVGHWYEKSLFRDGCIAPGDTPFCKNGFVDEVCMCKDVSCEPGYYCTKKGECKPWVSKDKKVLHTRYKYLSQQ